jgi:D-threo-aldose 1-dehydrogenase
VRERLVFGCGHLTGGATQITADRLISQCLDAGLRRFDTAPLYGLGTAEAALGMALRRDGREALINTKVGLPRPRFGALKSYLRAAKRSVVHPQMPLGVAPPRADGIGSPRGNFNPEGMASSLADSLRTLGVPRVETLFLHEAYADNISADAVAFLREAQRRNQARDLGVANGAIFDSSLAALVPPDFILQSAAPPDFFDGQERELSATLVFHTVINSFFWRCAVDAPLNTAVETCCRRFKSVLGDDPDAAIVLGYLLLGAAAPRAKLVYSTTERTRLDAFLKAMGAVWRANAAAEIISFTSVVYRKCARACSSSIHSFNP